MKVDEVILEMSEIGISGFPRRANTAAETLDVIKNGVRRTSKMDSVSLNESQDKKQDAMDRMSVISERYSKISDSIREQLQEAGNILKEMDEVAYELRRNFSE